MISDITIIKTIGHGATCKVKQGKLPNGQNVAVKIMNDNMSEAENKCLQAEVAAIS